MSIYCKEARTGEKRMSYWLQVGSGLSCCYTDPPPFTTCRRYASSGTSSTVAHNQISSIGICGEVTMNVMSANSVILFDGDTLAQAASRCQLIRSVLV